MRRLTAENFIFQGKERAAVTFSMIFTQRWPATLSRGNGERERYFKPNGFGGVSITTDYLIMTVK